MPTKSILKAANVSINGDEATLFRLAAQLEKARLGAVVSFQIRGGMTRGTEFSSRFMAIAVI